MYGKWKRITDIKEIGDKTDKVETVEFPEYVSSNCNLTTCRYNADGKCTNEEKRKECVNVAKSVLCIKDVEDKNPLNICETNENCECDPDKCSKAVDITMFADLPFRKFMCGRDKCKYYK